MQLNLAHTRVVHNTPGFILLRLLQLLVIIWLPVAFVSYQNTEAPVIFSQAHVSAGSYEAQHGQPTPPYCNGQAAHPSYSGIPCRPVVSDSVWTTGSRDLFAATSIVEKTSSCSPQCTTSSTTFFVPHIELLTFNIATSAVSPRVGAHSVPVEVYRTGATESLATFSAGQPVSFSVGTLLEWVGVVLDSQTATAPIRLEGLAIVGTMQYVNKGSYVSPAYFLRLTLTPLSIGAAIHHPAAPSDPGGVSWLLRGVQLTLEPGNSVDRDVFDLIGIFLGTLVMLLVLDHVFDFVMRIIYRDRAQPSSLLESRADKISDWKRSSSSAPATHPPPHHEQATPTPAPTPKIHQAATGAPQPPSPCDTAHSTPLCATQPSPSSATILEKNGLGGGAKLHENSGLSGRAKLHERSGVAGGGGGSSSEGDPIIDAIACRDGWNGGPTPTVMLPSDTHLGAAVASADLRLSTLSNTSHYKGGTRSGLSGLNRAAGPPSPIVVEELSAVNTARRVGRNTIVRRYITRLQVRLMHRREQLNCVAAFITHCQASRPSLSGRVLRISARCFLDIVLFWKGLPAQRFLRAHGVVPNKIVRRYTNRFRKRHGFRNRPQQGYHLARTADQLDSLYEVVVAAVDVDIDVSADDKNRRSPVVSRSLWSTSPVYRLSPSGFREPHDDSSEVSLSMCSVNAGGGPGILLNDDAGSDGVASDLLLDDEFEMTLMDDCGPIMMDSSASVSQLDSRVPDRTTPITRMTPRFTPSSATPIFTDGPPPDDGRSQRQAALTPRSGAGDIDFTETPSRRVPAVSRSKPAPTLPPLPTSFSGPYSAIRQSAQSHRFEPIGSSPMSSAASSPRLDASPSVVKMKTLMNQGSPLGSARTSPRLSGSGRSSVSPRNMSPRDQLKEQAAMQQQIANRLQRKREQQLRREETQKKHLQHAVREVQLQQMRSALSAADSGSGSIAVQSSGEKSFEEALRAASSYAKNPM